MPAEEERARPGATAHAGDDVPVSAPVLDAAIAWQLELDAGAEPAAHAAFSRWLEADPEHRRAWRQLCALDASLRPLQAAPLRAALLRVPRNRHRRTAAAVLAGALLAGVGLAALEQRMPLAARLADYGTATGERRQFALPDGSQLYLNTRSAVDLAFDSERRALHLATGEILVETAHAAAETRPFVVLTADGALRALGTRFVVRKLDTGTLLTVVHSAVAAQPARWSDERRIGTGERALVHADGVGPAAAAPAEADAWRDGMLVVENAPLAEVVAELGRYRPGHTGVDAALAGLRVTGTFSLDDSGRALQALADGLGLRLLRRGPWWLTLAPAT